MTDESNTDDDGSDNGGEKTEVTGMNVVTRFSAMANRPGGMPRDDALSRAETFIANIEVRYPEWVKSDMTKLVAQVEQIHVDEAFTDETHEAIYRQAGRIRDLGGTFGYDLTTRVGDSLCELIHRLAEGDHYSREALDAHIEALKIVCTPDFKGVPVTGAKELTDSLEQLVNRFPDPDAALKAKRQSERDNLKMPKRPT